MHWDHLVDPALDIDSDTRSLLQFHFTRAFAYTKEKRGENPLAPNHPNWWRLVFVSTTAYYITFDMMMRNSRNPTGILRVRSSLFHVINKEKPGVSVDLTAERGCAVGEVLQILLQAGYQHYRFTSHGRGNRWWVFRTVNKLEENMDGCLSAPSSYNLDRYIHREYEGRTSEPSLAISGTFLGI